MSFQLPRQSLPTSEILGYVWALNVPPPKCFCGDGLLTTQAYSAPTFTHLRQRMSIFDHFCPTNIAILRREYAVLGRFRASFCAL